MSWNNRKFDRVQFQRAFPANLMGDSQAVVNRGLARLEPQRLGEGGEALVPLSLVEQRCRQKQMRCA